METNIYPKAKKAEENDYVKFKKLLRFFVRQSEINAENGRAEMPIINIAHYRFIKHYELEPEFNKIAGLDFTIRFSLLTRYGTELTTYINIRQFNIIGNFERKKITHLRNFIRVNTEKITCTGEAKERCEEWNKTQRFYSIEELGIDKDNNDPPNDTLKKLLDEYLKGYNDLFEKIETYYKEINYKEIRLGINNEHAIDYNNFLKKANASLKLCAL
jgi:hypothetical protein